MIKIKTMLRLWMIILFVTAGFSQQVKAQGVDVIFWMDNSGSINATAWTNMTASTKSIINQVLGCNPLNRVAVVHYAGTYTGVSPGTPKIYIESDFTSNVTTAENFVRRGGQPTQGGTHYSTMGASDFASEALQVIGNALDATANSNIVSTQKKLTKTANNKLVIFYITDADRAYNSSWMVSQTNTANPFVVYNQFKTDRGATFVVLKVSSGSPTSSLEVAARETAAAIASVGGSYNGAVESNAGDPQGSGVKPRKAIISSTFSIPSEDITTLATNICKSCAPVVNLSAVTPPSQTVVLNSTAQNLVSTATGQGTLSYQWYSNTTNSTTGGTLITGATSATYTPPTSAVGTTYYYVVVSDSYCEGKATSAIVSVLIISDPCEITASNPDSDGDGISDFCDLDDDNDGILDTDECPNVSIISNGTFTSPVTEWTLGEGWDVSTGIARNENDSVNSNLSQTLNNLNQTNGTVKLSFTLGAQDGFNNGGFSASLNIILNGTTYATFTNGTVRTVGTNNVTQTLAGGVTSTFTPFSTATPGFTTQNITITIPYTGPDSAVLTFNHSAGRDDWSIDNVSIDTSICDLDGDGISNELDLDSDGDGCPDAIEGGAAFTTSNLVNSSMPGGNTGGSYTGTAGPVTSNLGNTVGNAATTMGVPTIAVTGQGVGDAQNASENSQCNTFCYKPGFTDPGNTYPTKHGITALGRAGAENDNWPMVRQSAWTVLEAKTKGFVVNRVKFNTSNEPVADDGATLVITSPIEGMMVYDTTNNCLKIYTLKEGDTAMAWHCFVTPACPQ